ncbi:ATP-binding protein [Acidicapsa ligni]|uniref:ATP-binding protein n=1 Tax=Acidicapsa ligni TaxID=542300 RepID=UPI0021DFF147|nr:ATP-binding protein [Acidicapsa ligni]
MLAVLLLLYAALVFAFQYVVLTRQIFHDEVQDVETVEGLLFFDVHGALQLRQDYYSRPQSHLLIDRMMEVLDSSGTVLYRSPTLNGMPLSGPPRPGEGDSSFDEHLVRLRDGSHVFLISHIHDMQGRRLLIRLGYDLGPLRSRMYQFFVLLLVAIPIALGLAALAGQAIAKRALRPLNRMAQDTEQITASNLHHRLEVLNPNDELGHIAQVFNHLLNRLEQAFIQLQRFTADAAHELRTPIAALRTVGEVALERGQDSEVYREAIGSILEETARLNETIDSLLLLARAEATQPGNPQTVFAVQPLVDEVLDLLQVVIDERRISVIEEGSPTEALNVRADKPLLRIAILNVLHNAVKFSPTGSTLRISYNQLDKLSPTLCIGFHDQGPGIATGEHERVFDRFFTSSSLATAPMSGAGLGLSVAKLVIQRIGGEIRFDQDVRSGARCLIELPVFER